MSEFCRGADCWYLQDSNKSDGPLTDERIPSMVLNLCHDIRNGGLTYANGCEPINPALLEDAQTAEYVTHALASALEGAQNA